MGRGRPVGTKKIQDVITNEDTPRRGRGRPVGTKKIQDVITNEDTPRRGRGRPVGTKKIQDVITNEAVIKEITITKIIDNYTKICTSLSQELVELRRDKNANKKDITHLTSNLNSCSRVLLLLYEQEGKTKLSQAKIKKIDNKAEETQFEKIMLGLNGKE